MHRTERAKDAGLQTAHASLLYVYVHCTQVDRVGTVESGYTYLHRTQVHYGRGVISTTDRIDSHD